MTMENGETLVMRSIYASSLDHPDANSPCEVDAAGGDVNSVNNSSKADDEAKNSITLPQSTNSLLFTEPVISIPFGFAFAILCISCSSLSFALIDALASGGPGNQFNIPADVSFVVRGAQLLTILIVLLMEEEIPTGLHLLRMIPRKSFEKEFTDRRYEAFVLSAVLRICFGYLFLMNVLMVLIQATTVLEIFYDCMALQFLQQLDDISFRLAKMDMVGKSIYRSTTAKCYRSQFKKQKRGKKASILLKAIYFLNIGVFLAVVVYVAVRQSMGFYQCRSVTVDFGDSMWEDAVLKNPKSGQYEERMLMYSFFNGVYEMIDGIKHDGRPVYKERRKYDGTPYENITGAEFKFCIKERAWIFTHENMKKSKDLEESGCSNWLLRNQQTRGYDLLSVEGDWDTWVGIIEKMPVSVVCNECHKESDCNLKGECISGKCSCRNGNGAQYLGPHCEVKLRDECTTIIGDGYNDTWSISEIPGLESNPTILQQYNRPVFSYDNTGSIPDVPSNDRLSLLYSGSRWFGVYFEDSQNVPSEEWIFGHTPDYHAFWDEIYSPEFTYIVSDQTTSSTPAGVDLYFLGEQGGQPGHFGELVPIQLYNQPGRGLYRCSIPALGQRDNTTHTARMLMLKRTLARRGKP